MKLACTLYVESYIAHPYWPETDDVINIQKRSGMNRARTDDSRHKALKEHLKKEGVTLKDYDELLRKSRRPWYRVDNDDETSPIVIPRHQLAGALVQTVNTAPAAVRGKYRADSFRYHVQLSDFVTEKMDADRVYDRYVKLEGSNQRSRQKNALISDFEAAGTIVVADDTKVADLQRLIDYALTEIGVGAARKMGHGRGHVLRLDGVR
jgi:hypothetical protein